jgi:formamidopyrimidine-DNA glycosylase
MPELPEVETVRRTLAPLIGQRVIEVWSSGLPLRLNRPVPLASLRQAAVGGRVEAVRRWGKYLLIDVADRPASVLVHLGMSGRLRLQAGDSARAAHTHVVFVLDRSRRTAQELRFSDPRRFGMVEVAPRGRERQHPALARLGIDPLNEVLSGADLYRASRGRERSIKALLLDQEVIAGVGNIYASEALWQAQIRPTQRAARLSRARCDALADAVRAVLERALTHGGTSLRDFVDADGHAGEHAGYLWVYDRAGRACVRPGCGSTIRRAVQHGRATFFCPRCQPAR